MQFLFSAPSSPVIRPTIDISKRSRLSFRNSSIQRVRGGMPLAPRALRVQGGEASHRAIIYKFRVEHRARASSRPDNGPAPRERPEGVANGAGRAAVPDGRGEVGCCTAGLLNRDNDFIMIKRLHRYLSPNNPCRCPQRSPLDERE